MTLSSMRDLFIDNLRDLYSAETQLTRALPRMAKAATTPALKKAFEQHLVITKGQIERLDKVFSELGTSPRGKRCMGMEGLLKESEEFIKEKGDPSVKDAGLIAQAQRVEHYEIAGYGTVRTYAQQLGLKQAARLLERTLDEESKTDEKLNQIAEKSINLQAQEQTEGGKAQPTRRAPGASARGASQAASPSRSSRAGASSSGKTTGGRSQSRAASTAKTRMAQRGSTSTKGRSSRQASSRRQPSSRGETEEEQGRAPETRVSTDHDEIRRWAEQRGAHPACVRGTGTQGDIGMIRLDFPGYSGEESLDPISWEEFFAKFDERKLALLYREETAQGAKSNFNKLISREEKK